MMMIRNIAAILLLLAPSATVITAIGPITVVSESRNRLPMSLSQVVADLEADGVTTVSTACLITSRSVTAAERRKVVQQLLGAEDDSEDGGDDLSTAKVVATSNGLALAQPQALEEVVQSCVACSGLVVFVPSAADLSRGEGLMDALAPAMERLQQWQEDSTVTATKPTLVVVYDGNSNKATTQAKLEAAAASISHTSTSMDDVFSGGVLYLTADQVAASCRDQQSTSPEDAMALVARVVASEGVSFLSQALSSGVKLSNAHELAAARALEPAKRQALQAALGLVKEATNNDSKLVPAFGALTDAVLKQAKESFAASSANSNNNNKALSTSVGKELAYSLTQELASEWMDAFEIQLGLLEEASFASFQAALGTLRLGPTLASDMEAAVQTTTEEFGTLAKDLLPKHVGTHTAWKARAKVARAALQSKLQDFCQDRLLAAEASGQFKPVPRKGFTVGMHWLLPKPFGNDYRQEPWSVHATDNLVYVPRRSSKVTDVPSEDVALEGDGDWRDQVVPSPAGRDMLYMQ